MDYWPVLFVLGAIWGGFHILHRELDRRFKEIERRLDVIFDRQRPDGGA